MTSAPIDLRSDTVTRPTPGMRKAIADAVVGDDVYGEDSEVNALEEEVAAFFGRDAAVFTPSGIMATQILLRVLTRPGTEVVCESDAHIVAYEAGAAAINAQVQFRTVDGDRGRLDVERLGRSLRPPTFPHTEVSAISVEETTNRGGGAVHGLARLVAIGELARERGLVFHGDGARLFNALVATGEDPRAVGGVFTAFSVCLSKGLGAPVGSLAIGDADVIAEARAWRRRFGGAMRQAGVLAAAGRYAMDNHLVRLADDHANARVIAEVVASAVPGAVDPSMVETNMVYVDTGRCDAGVLAAGLAGDGVLTSVMGPTTLRLVTHLDVDASACAEAAARIAAALRAADAC